MSDLEANPSVTDSAPKADQENPHQAVTVVIPCFNEEIGLPYLAERLAALTDELEQTVRLSFVLVDDGSTDATWDAMRRLFEADPRFAITRHTQNRGIAAASLTGIRKANDEVVAVIDSDCTYDPSLIAKMLPKLAEDVSIVTASPYHPMGGVEGVPRWRLFLSRGASWAYRRLLRNKLSTYTSCFRVYRRSAVLSVTPRYDGFTGVAERLALLDRQGWRIVEVPALLETRRFGESKLRIAHVIRGHVGLMLQIAMARLTNQWTPTPALSVTSAFDQES